MTLVFRLHDDFASLTDSINTNGQGMSPDADALHVYIAIETSTD
jgi:hypothetical protein